ncbi:MAG: phosphoglycerate kinase [Phycisphaerales bacterium]|nr:phosphoglycerate kinase [Phycisphaerales bacterium]MCI0631055.1 phosphoglycerate kinase [Phycisphaerales bacterium]MCI0674290.1 phosphoglycerate kinase [Phycisphaerales bacterium]
MAKKTIDQVDVASKRVLTRVDFNVPIDDEGKITDDRRIRQALPTIKSVIERRGKLILMSHLGRPEGKGFEPEHSLKPVAARLAELLPGVKVMFPGNDCVGPEAASAISAMNDREIVVLENLRFHKQEKTGDGLFAAKLANYGDIYCNDAFGTAHRNDASMLAVPLAMKGKPRVAGLLLQKELKYLSEAINNAKPPFVAVLGGAKVSDKLGAIRNLMSKVDTILVGGAMAYTFLKALGQEVGSSLVEARMVNEANAILAAAAASRTDLVLPQDHVCGKQISQYTPVEVHEGNIPYGWMGLDIGPKTSSQFGTILAGAKTVIWNGPMGVFETQPFDVGTKQVAQAIARATKKGAMSVVGGGETAAAVEAFGMAEQFSHVSTGGGASLEMLEGKAFDSIAVLDDA